MVDIVVLGCTGVSGRQTVLYLANHPQRSQFSLAIAARSRKKLGVYKYTVVLNIEQ